MNIIALKDNKIVASQKAYCSINITGGGKIGDILYDTVNITDAEMINAYLSSVRNHKRAVKHAFLAILCLLGIIAMLVGLLIANGAIQAIPL